MCICDCTTAHITSALHRAIGSSCRLRSRTWNRLCSLVPTGSSQRTYVRAADAMRSHRPRGPAHELQAWLRAQYVRAVHELCEEQLATAGAHAWGRAAPGRLGSLAGRCRGQVAGGARRGVPPGLIAAALPAELAEACQHTVERDPVSSRAGGSLGGDARARRFRVGRTSQ